MKYKRLTIPTEWIPHATYINCLVNTASDIKLKTIDIGEIYNRLSELEDKLEDGTLVDITVPYLRELTKRDGMHKYQIWHKVWIEEIDEEFDDKQEAEARLKELRGE